MFMQVGIVFLTERHVDFNNNNNNNSNTFISIPP